MSELGNLLDDASIEDLRRIKMLVLGDSQTGRPTRPKPRGYPPGVSTDTLFYGTTPNAVTTVSSTVTVANTNDVTDTIEAKYDRKATNSLAAETLVWCGKARGDTDWHIMIWACDDEV